MAHLPYTLTLTFPSGKVNTVPCESYREAQRIAYSAPAGTETHVAQHVFATPRVVEVGR